MPKSNYDTEKDTDNTKKTNYNFLLKCMGALAAAAVLSAGVYAIVAAKTTTTTAGLVGATAAAGPIGALAAIIGLSVLIAAACILPCLAPSSTTVYTSGPRYNGWWGGPSWWSGPSWWGSGYGNGIRLSICDLNSIAAFPFINWFSRLSR